jgi:DNA processing protein
MKDLYSLKEFSKEEFQENYFLKKFLEIPDCPKKIYSAGIFPPEHFHTLAIVGSRNISSYGKDVLERIINGLKGQQISIISGLALGIDAEAHRLALKNNIHTIAIPGSGLESSVIYPKTNKNLTDKILLEKGLLLSEFEPHTKAAIWTFPARNRLMAALADVVLVVEATHSSGTLITARLALEYNKDVLAVPGSIFHKNSEGTNKLISQGAKLVTSTDDILECFGIFKSDPEKDFKEINTEDLSEIEKEILSILKEPKSKDKIIEIINKSPNEILGSLSLLEWKSFIKEENGILRRIV